MKYYKVIRGGIEVGKRSFTNPEHNPPADGQTFVEITKDDYLKPEAPSAWQEEVEKIKKDVKDGKALSQQDRDKLLVASMEKP